MTIYENSKIITSLSSTCCHKVNFFVQKDQVFIVYLVAEDFKDTAGAEQVSELISERLAEVCRNRNKPKAKDFNLYSVYMILHSNGHYWNKKDTNFVFKS